MFLDIRYGILMLVKKPGFTFIATVSLGLAMAANSTMFSFIDAILLKPLAYKDSERLVAIWELSSRGEKIAPSPSTFLKWRGQSQSFSHLAAVSFTVNNLNLTGLDQAERVRGRSVSANYFGTLGVQLQIGRPFLLEEEGSSSINVAILANRFWRQKLGGNTNLIGATVNLNNESYVIVGVLPADGVFDKEACDIWLPIKFNSEMLNQNAPLFQVIGRLKQDVTTAQADTEMKLIRRTINQSDRSHNIGVSAFVEPLRNQIVNRPTKTILFLLMGAALLVLLLACANVANLFLARGEVRQQEVAIRAALGASQLRLVQQFFTESLLITITSGAVGIVLAHWLTRSLVTFIPQAALPIEAEISFDWRILLFSIVVSVLIGIFFGLILARQAMRVNLTPLLQARNAGAFSALNRHKSRSVFLVLEIALSFALTIGAGLMIHSFVRLIQVDLGFETKNILTFRANLDPARYPQQYQTMRYQLEALRRLRTLPGVTSVAVSNALPLGGTSAKNAIQISSMSTSQPGARLGASVRVVSPDYFTTLGIRLLQGRSFSEQDIAQGLLVTVINQSLARRSGIESAPLGTQVEFLGDNFSQIKFNIIGVVANTKHRSPQSQAEDEIYILFNQVPAKAFSSVGKSLFFAVKTSGDPRAMTSAIQTMMATLDKDQAIFDVSTLEQMYADSITQPRFLATLLSLFGFLALTLAATGIYGVISYSVTQRTREIGVRIALGAQTGNIVRAVIGQWLLLVWAGIVLGSFIALGLSRYLSSLLYDIKPTDARTYFTTAAIMTFVTLLASYLPARRATRVDPIAALKHE